MILGVDVGGTFTDVAGWDGASLRTAKVPTTPDQSAGVVSGARRVASGRLTAFLHGTTVATNALLERAGARTALVTTAGFRDVLEIGRQDRPSLYDTFADRPEPLVPRELRFEADERLGPAGEPIRPLADVAGLVDAVVAAAPEAVAVALLYGFAAPAHEEQLAAALRERLPGVPVSAGSRVSGEFREYERAATTALNAYLAPATGRYLSRLVTAAREAGLADDVAVMRSSGGLLRAAQAADLPAAVLLSGPAGGVVAAAELGRALGRARVVSFDMGGTSTDVCRIEEGRPEVAYERAVAGHPCRMPAVAVHTVGAGGGSIAWVDPGGALRVGPRSAGARPGPACYGLGGAFATVTDANLARGRLAPAARLAGSLELRPDRAREALARLAAEARIDAGAAAGGIVAIVEEHMARAVRRVSVEQGADPRDAALVAFGGAGGLHATAMARALGMAGVVVPPHAGVFSALGLLLSPPRADAARSTRVETGGTGLDEAIREIGEAARRELGGAVEVTTLVDARYVGQSHETTVPYQAGDGWRLLEERFHAEHRARNGFDRRGDPVEVVTLRGTATGRPALRWDQLPPPAPAGEPRRGERIVDGTRAAVWWRPALAPGTELAGPAVVEEPQATTFLATGERARVHDSGALEIDW